ncbi:MFSD6 [Scenedesmus sp. PABB004]|nr:MFSD6 [Scenedesmus sp. PABB004]
MQTKHFYLLGKVWYTFYWAGLASITPYFNVYFKQRGLSDAQIGVISAARQWVSVPSSFMWSAAADRLSAHRAILAAVLVASTASRLGLVWVSGFGGFLALVIANQFVTSPVTVMCDAIVMSNCEADGDYGKIRAWGALGWGGWSSAAGAIISRWGMAAGFFTSAIITAPCVAASWVMRFGATKQQQHASEQKEEQAHKEELAEQQGAEHGSASQAALPGGKGDAEQPPRACGGGSCSSSCGSAGVDAVMSAEPPPPRGEVRDDAAARARAAASLSFSGKLRLLLSSGEVWLFLWQSMLQGFGLGIYQSYLFILLQEMGASALLMGLSITVDCIAEFPAFHYQKEILRFISLDALIHISVITYSVRLACYALLPLWGSPWTVLPVQLLHGATYAAGWGAGTIKSKQLAQHGLQATMQGIFQATYVGIGQGVGSLLGGLLMGRLGGQIMFAICAGLVGAGWLVSLAWAALLRCGRRRAAQTPAARVAGGGPGRSDSAAEAGKPLEGGLSGVSAAGGSLSSQGAAQRRGRLPTASRDEVEGLVLVREPSDIAGPCTVVIKP